MRDTIHHITDIILEGGSLDRDSAFELASAKGPDLWDLLASAGRIREHYRGNRVDICSIINAKSGACSEDCAYCAQSMHHSTKAPVYPLIPVDEMVRSAESAKKNRAGRFCIVTSGRNVDSRGDLERIAEGVRRVKAIGLAPCATLGTLSRDQLLILKQAGLKRYHHNIETSKEFFSSICSTHTFDDRLTVLRDAISAGLSVCSGGILGMGESMQDRISMAITLRGLGVDSIPLNFLMPIPGTPLEACRAITPLEALHSIAMFRLLLPDKEIRVCAGRGAALGNLHPLIFAAGADGFMIGNYLTTNGLDPEQDLNMVRDLELTI